MRGGMLSASSRREADPRALGENGLLGLPAESDGLRTDLIFPSLQRLAFLDLPIGDWPARRCAVCRHLGPQNWAVERRGMKGRRHMAQAIAMSRSMLRPKSARM